MFWLKENLSYRYTIKRTVPYFIELSVILVKSTWTKQLHKNFYNFWKTISFMFFAVYELTFLNCFGKFWLVLIVYGIKNVLYPKQIFKLTNYDETYVNFNLFDGWFESLL